MLYPEPVSNLIEAFQQLPGIGPKTAQRLTLHLLRKPREEADSLAKAIRQARSQIRQCRQCFHLATGERCTICNDERRNSHLICVVEQPTDVLAMERTHEYHGLYHVLHGAISPMDGVGPEDLYLDELLERLSGSEVEEVIVATNPTMEGEATALYLARVIKSRSVRVTRIARGLPEGGDLDYVDEVTLSRALQGRREVEEP